MTMVRSLLLIVCLSSAFVLTDIITFVSVEACPDEQLPALIGFPFVHRTSVPWVNSMSGVLYLKGLLLNVLLISTAFSFMGMGLRRILSSRWPQSRSRVALEWSLIVASVLVITFCLVVVEWDLQWSADFDFRCPERTLQVARHFR